jgi:iron complex outermembrane receptor protein
MKTKRLTKAQDRITKSHHRSRIIDKAYDDFLRDGDLPSDRTLAGAVLLRVLKAREPVPPSGNTREMLFREAACSVEPVRTFAQWLLKALVRAGGDPTDPECIGPEMEPQDFSPVCLRLVGWPEDFVKPEKQEQLKRVLRQQAEVRAQRPLDDDQWDREAGAALRGFFQRGEIPGPRFYLYVRTIAEPIAVLDHYLGRTGDELVAAFDAVARAGRSRAQPPAAALADAAVCNPEPADLPDWRVPRTEAREEARSARDRLEPDVRPSLRGPRSGELGYEPGSCLDLRAPSSSHGMRPMRGGRVPDRHRPTHPAAPGRSRTSMRLPSRVPCLPQELASGAALHSLPALSLALGLALSGMAPLLAQGTVQDPATHDVTAFEIEDLLNVRVISAAKREQVLTQVPAAISVIRADDIKRSGARTIAEALRLVPGMQVARTRSGTWAISARGFNDNLSNKLLVMIDGRSVYSPLHSGVFWDVQDVHLPDVDRIEVIRGPGGSLWGANAINGIVNVITKSAKETQGSLLTLGGGTEDRAFGEMRYGTRVADDVHVRLYGRFTERDDAADGSDPEQDAYDGWHVGRFGARADWDAGARDLVSVMADAYDGRARERLLAPNLTSPVGADLLQERREIRGASVVARWQREIDATSDLQLQFYYDHTFRDDALFRDQIDTLDLDFQHRFSPGDGHDVNWGLGYRVYIADFVSSFAFQITPESRTDSVATGFLQDEIALCEDVRLTIGCKLEHNDYSDFEFQPSARLALSIDEHQTVWTSVTRAVRTPSIVDVDARLTPIVVPGAVPLAFSIIGDDGFESEELLAYEAGYRTQLAERVTADLAVFYNDYDRLRSGTPGATFIETTPIPYVVVPINLGNELGGKTWGSELALNYQASTWWLLQSHYSYLGIDLSENSGQGRDPRHTAMLRSSMQIGDFSFDATVRYVSALAAFDIDEYVEASLRVAWSDPAAGFEAALVGHDLVHEDHAEFESADQRSEIQRGAFLMLTWTF